MTNNKLIITSKFINDCKSALTFNEYVEQIEVNLSDCEYEYYKCVFALSNIPYNLKKLTINIKEKKYIERTVQISRNGDLSGNVYLHLKLPDIAGNTKKYTIDEFKTKIKIPYACEFIINKTLIHYN